jgi:exportin-1
VRSDDKYSHIVAMQVLKQDWPHKWPSFIPDIVAASKTSEPLCENSMVILKLLSEEIFDFSRGELTQARLSPKAQMLQTGLSVRCRCSATAVLAEQRAGDVRLGGRANLCSRRIAGASCTLVTVSL